jgi:hypothetical protein
MMADSVDTVVFNRAVMVARDSIMVRLMTSQTA